MLLPDKTGLYVALSGIKTPLHQCVRRLPRYALVVRLDLLDGSETEPMDITDSDKSNNDVLITARFCYIALPKSLYLEDCGRPRRYGGGHP